MDDREFFYDAFISYRTVDQAFARSLEKEIESYVLITDDGKQRRHLNAFRYQGEMSGAEYYSAIEGHLRKSKKLIVICSPEARESPYVNHEIRSFATMREPVHVLSLLLKGFPNNVTNPAEKALSAFPEELCKIQVMPLSKDYRGFNPHKHRISKPPFDTAWYSLLADILEKSVDEVTRKELKRKLRARNRVILGISVLIVVLTALSAYAFVQKNQAEESKKTALANEHLAIISRKAAEDSAKVAKAERELAKLAHIKADSNAEIAKKEELRAEQQALLAKKNALEATLQSLIADANADTARQNALDAQRHERSALTARDETERINELVQSENLALRSIASKDPKQKLTLAQEALELYVRRPADTSVFKASKKKFIYEALYRSTKPLQKELGFEGKFSFQHSGKLFIFGNDLRTPLNGSCYSVIDLENPAKIISRGLEPDLPAYAFQLIKERDLLLSFHANNTVGLWKLRGNDFELIDFVRIGNSLYRKSAYSSLSRTFAIAGNSNDVLVLSPNAEFINSSIRSFPVTTPAADIFYLEDTLYVLATNGNLLKLREESLEEVMPKTSESKATSSRLTEAGTLYVGHENGTISFTSLRSAKRIWRDLPYKGETRIEIMQILDQRSLLVTHANKLVHIYDLRYALSKSYQPLVISNLEAKVRASCYYKEFLYLTLSDGTLHRYDLNIQRLLKGQLLKEQVVTSEAH